MKFRYFLYFAALVSACSSPVEQDAEMVAQAAPVWPDVANVTVPRNLAPVRFVVDDDMPSQAIFTAVDQCCIVGEDDGQIAIAPDDWKRLMASGDSIVVRIQSQKDDSHWIEYEPFAIKISADSIDPFLTYRLIEPGYEVWSEMGIYQRDLTTYDEHALLENSETNGGCMNCHTSHHNNGDTVLFHLRAEMAGTYIAHNGEARRIAPKGIDPVPTLVYPAWHPTGRYVAFSSNRTKQAFHSSHRNRIEVFDTSSDLYIYEVESQRLITRPTIHSNAAFETYPTFSPDGRWLYFCSADSLNVFAAYDSVRYSLCRVAFDADGATIGQDVDTIFNARTQGRSALFPRISPDGRWLLFTVADFGNFSIWHREADLHLLDLHTGQEVSAEALNSPESESFHSWSSNGRWIVFSSRRMDGLYTRPYLAHVDADGQLSKPVVVPQSHARFYQYSMKSYNVPEFSRSQSVKINIK